MTRLPAALRRFLTRAPRTAGARTRPPLRLEGLEPRAVPATFYVATTGADGASGDAANPLRTLQHAAGRVQAGDTVVVRAGNYAGFHLTADGTAAARITFSGEAGATITARNPVTNDGINLEGADYVTVQGFAVTGIGRAGIRSVVNTGAVIRNNTCDQNGSWGILTGFSENLTIEGNTTSRSGAEHGIYVSNSADNPVIRGNVSWGNRANGIHMNGDRFAGGDGVISSALVENNVLYDNGAGGGSGINADGVQNSVFRNNLIYNTHASGISLYRIDGGGSSTGNLVVNNTVLVAADGRWALNISDASTGNAVRNNILFSAHPFRGAVSVSADSLPGLVSDHNLTEDRFSTDGGGSALTQSQWRVATGQDANSLATANPSTLFVNAAGGDYHLAETSAAVDRGTTTGAPPTDAEGTARPSGTAVDIGHDEFATSPPLPSPLPVVSVGNVQMNEGDAAGTATFTVTLSAASAISVSVQYATQDGTAAAGSDYTATSGTVTFAAGQTSATVAVGILGGTSVEPDETFSLILSIPTGATIGTGTGVATLLNDDTAPPPQQPAPEVPAPSAPVAVPVPAPAVPYYTNAVVTGTALVLRGAGVPGGATSLAVPSGSSAVFADVNGDAKGDVILVLPDVIAVLDGATGRFVALVTGRNTPNPQVLLFSPDGGATRLI